MTDSNIVEEFNKGTGELIDDTEDIDELLQIWSEVTKMKKQFEGLESRLKDKIKAYLKERFWNDYMDKKSKIKVTLSTMKRENIDKEMLKMMLTPSQIASVTKISTSEQMRIATPEIRKRMRKYAKGK